MEPPVVELDQPSPPHWLVLAKTVVLTFLIYKSARLLYVPYTPMHDPNYTRASFLAATERVCAWIGLCSLFAYVLYTRRLVRTTWSGKLAYRMMIAAHVYFIFFIIDLLISIPPDHYDNEPFFG